jgi:hypothetical protein
MPPNYVGRKIGIDSSAELDRFNVALFNGQQLFVFVDLSGKLSRRFE